jgi:Fe-Mn family superoxide dismutase
MTHYLLPELGYDYDALEPHISGKIMELHHDKHHRAYVDGANAAVDKFIEARGSRDFAQIAALERQIAFHVSGHVLHSIFWRNLSPEGGGKPTGELGETIERDFGGFEAFKDQIVHAATTLMGSGWAVLVWDPIARRLGTTQVHDHQSQVTQAAVPLMVIDGWEHAYYLQYQTEKARYFEALWNIWNWEDVGRRLESARKLELELEGVAEDWLAPRRDGGKRGGVKSRQEKGMTGRR